MFAVGAAELTLRAFFRDMPASLWSERGHLVPAADPLAVYGYRPGASYHGYSINRWGFRDRDWRETKDSGTYRIAAVGDSFTFGHAVSRDESWVKQLEQRLGEVDGQRVEVLNFGVQGYNTRNELGVLRTQVLRFHPDMVLLAHVEGDALPDFMRLTRGQLVFQFESDPDRRIPLPVAAKEFLYRHLFLYRLAATRYLSHFQGDVQGELQAARRKSSASRLEAARLARRGRLSVDRRTLGEIARTCQAAKVRLALLDFPLTPRRAASAKTRAQVSVSKQLARLAKRQGIPVIDLFPVVQETRLAELRVSPDDYHPSAALHAEYARYLEPRIRRLVEADRPVR